MGSCDYEAVSALVDGELEEQECDAVIRHLNECRECCHLFERFHATRNLVRGESGPSVPGDFCERVSAAIANERPHMPDNVTPLPEAGQRPATVARTAWGWAATAAGLVGVALVAGVLLSRTPAPGDAGSSPTLAQSSQSAPSEAATPAPTQPEPENVAAIKRYLPEHSSFVPSSTGAEFQRTRLQLDKR
ncbi:MAG TPA: sigma-E factor negative regulatory protein [Gammaproteobacteria bacterium]|nr:sigma-E factor negative regulatory protein [Gammaproteobacteria bacterium]